MCARKLEVNPIGSIARPENKKRRKKEEENYNMNTVEQDKSKEPVRCVPADCGGKDLWKI